jgi:Domain of unknown function (DUF4388)/Bacterial SH3 domain
MGFSGRLEGIAPSDIFQIISQSRMTGTLIARCQEGTAMIVFKDGRVIEAASDARKESLAFLLVSQGIVNEKTIKTAEHEMKKKADQLLGATLVDMGAISEKVLEEVVLKQIAQIVQRLVSCVDGFITFDRGETAVNRKINIREFLFPSGVSTEYLIMENARVIDEERRSGIDRRDPAGDPLPKDGSQQEAALPAGEQARSGAAVRSLFVRFRGLWLPNIAALQSTVGAVVQKGKEIAKAARDLFQRSIMPRFASAVHTVRAVSPDGRTLIYTGATGTATGIALILLFMLTSHSPTNELLITGRVVNIRATPATNAKVAAKVDRGETLALLSSERGWYQVRTPKGATGWIWGKLAERKGNNGTAVIYGMAGAGFVLVAGLALLVTGIMRKRKYVMRGKERVESQVASSR